MATFMLSGPGLVLTFRHAKGRLCLAGMARRGGRPMLFADKAGRRPGVGPLGGPLLVTIGEGPHAGRHGMDRFRVKQLKHTDRRLLAYLAHDRMPLEVGIEVEVEGHVATWRGQACWNGDTALEADICFPLFSRMRFSPQGPDRAVVAQLSGAVYEPLDRVNFQAPYVGNLSSPCFLVEGGGRGLAVLDDNRADYAADPGAGVRRSCVVANQFPVPRKAQWFDPDPEGGEDGPLVAVCHTRRFNPNTGSLTADDRSAEGGLVRLPMQCLGDGADLGPVRTYAYEGTWKVGAAWLRDRRRWVPMRVSPAAWFRRNTFIGEHMGDTMVRAGQTFYDYPKVHVMKKRLGTDFWHIPGYHDPEILGTPENWLSRGDYFFAAQNLGGFEAARRGVEAVHRAGGRMLYYVEGLILWKRSRIGRSRGRAWALVKADGTYDDHYKGFWHMCPACREWREWLAEECAAIVRTVGVDGFFIDSTCATHYHRCFNPEHRHPHPDVWNWGLRHLARAVREAVDRVNPETILFFEGVGDIAREFIDGSLAHTHDWTRGRFTEPIGRFLHPDMRAYESWCRSTSPDPRMPRPNPRRLHVWNSVNGYRIYSHDPSADEVADLGQRTRQVYDAYPEICDNPVSVLDVRCAGGLAQLFEGAPPVVTVGNPTGRKGRAVLELPMAAGVLFDRVDALRVPVIGRQAEMRLAPWEFRAFEVRP